jgi:hypothetical protein
MATWEVKRTLKTVVTQEVEAKTAEGAIVTADKHWRDWTHGDLEEIIDETVKGIEGKD